MRKYVIGMAVLAACGFGQAFGALTTINEPWAPATSNASELNLTGTGGILDLLQAGDIPSGAAAFGLSGATFTRVDDSVDQIWQVVTSQDLQATAVFASASQVGGYIPGVLGGSFSALTGSISANGFLSPAPATVTGPLVTGDLFRWALESTLNGGTKILSSRASDNAPVGPGVTDLMVTYEISGVAGLDNAYIIAFEDGQTDFDYNDFVAIVEGVVPIPEPGAALLGLIGLGAVLKRRMA
jgi:hypothetical protein